MKEIKTTPHPIYSDEEMKKLEEMLKSKEAVPMHFMLYEHQLEIRKGNFISTAKRKDEK